MFLGTASDMDMVYPLLFFSFLSDSGSHTTLNSIVYTCLYVLSRIHAFKAVSVSYTLCILARVCTTSFYSYYVSLPSHVGCLVYI
ncbi:hypothetical protein K504DRAFT_46744 [Pleomassaria siparia CBS 279.74]|uniref:Uncharacterized protein n=1 Tax=Pleomassaria siparia CBS 279.74 TaxID=1314801 RepID=A0A6G1K4U5_9PLEO|nr:hypothetical protein K504DRAFT_46744 [Pleomassaria siparia CBS 279.74]